MAIQTEIQRHNLSTFMSAKHMIVPTGRSACRKYFEIIEQFKFHLCDDVVPPQVDRLSSEAQ
jgi:hypothetical protein